MATLYNEYKYEDAAELGLTIKRLDTKQFWDGTAWVATEPKPFLMAREPEPTAFVRVLDVPAPDNLFPPGDYSARFWTLGADGAGVEMIDMIGHYIRPPVVVKVDFSFGVTGNSGQ